MLKSYKDYIFPHDTKLSNEFPCRPPTWRMLAFVSLSICLATSPSNAEPIHVPTERPLKLLFEGPTLVTTGFSGTKVLKPLSQDGAPDDVVPPLLREFIDPDGAVATLLSISRFDGGASAQEIQTRPYDRLKAGEIGQVFGIALDSSNPPSLFLAATSVFGLNINGSDRNEDYLPDRLKKGAGDANWAKGQFGSLKESGPGSIYKVNGRTGQIALFANTEHEGLRNAAPGIGNLAYDTRFDVLFASDLDTGLIHRFASDGRELSSFDHGANARVNENLEAIENDPALRADIKSAEFDPDTPQTWGFAKAERRVWGLALQNGRLYYSVAIGLEARPEIWSVGLHEKTGDFLEDAKWEFSLPERLDPTEISDIDFTANGSLIIAQRSAVLAPFDYKKLSDAGMASVVRFVKEDPEDPKSALTPSDWVEVPIEYDIGFAARHKNANGGIALGPNYTARGTSEQQDCKGTLWATGDSLRESDSIEIETSLAMSGALPVHGVQAQPVALDTRRNSPPWVSYFHDYDAEYHDDLISGHVGDVEVLGCVGAGGFALPPEQVATTPDEIPEDPSLCKGATCLTLLCLANPSMCLPKQNACMTVEQAVSCDPESGNYVLQIQAADRMRAPVLDGVKVSQAGSSITVLPLNSNMGSPVVLPLTGYRAGQVGHIELCAYNKADQASGQPFECCNETISFVTPNAVCEKENSQ